MSGLLRGRTGAGGARLPGHSASVTEREDLPRLLYLGDVPVEATVGGAALMYRLLQSYPIEKLRIVQSTLWESGVENRVPGADYSSLRAGSARPLRTRFGHVYARYLYAAAPFRAAKVKKRVASFAPEAVLAVAHGPLWRAAAVVASSLRIPLHLIIHDDRNATEAFGGMSARRAEACFASVYRSAASRMCVSPYMAHLYQARYGVPGTVLYPLRAHELPEFSEPPRHDHRGSRPFTVAYAGSLATGAYRDGLAALSEVLERVNGRLEVYAPGGEGGAAADIVRPNVRVHPALPPPALVERLRRDADALFVPMSFLEGDRINVEVSFPSKLTDYTAAGLPLLIWGPAYCSAARWAQEHQGVAEVVTLREPRAVAEAVAKLAADAGYRDALGRRALQVGRELFSHSSVMAQFHDVLRSAASVAGPRVPA